VLKADFPARAGDSEQIVVQARQGTLRSAAAEAAVTSMLGRVARLPHVQSVVSPYAPGGLISRDGTIGLATVNLDAQAQDIPTAAVTALVSTARSADSSLLNVQLGGAAVQNSQSSGGNTSLLLGIVLALIVLFFAFRRSMLGAVLPLISALAAIGWAPRSSKSCPTPSRSRRSRPRSPSWYRSGWEWTTRCSSPAGTATGCWPGRRGYLGTRTFASRVLT